MGDIEITSKGIKVTTIDNWVCDFRVRIEDASGCAIECQGFDLIRAIRAVAHAGGILWHKEMVEEA